MAGNLGSCLLQSSRKLGIWIIPGPHLLEVALIFSYLSFSIERSFVLTNVNGVTCKTYGMACYSI